MHRDTRVHTRHPQCSRAHTQHPQFLSIHLVFRPDVRGSNQTWKPQCVRMTAATSLSMQTPRRPVMSQRLPISSPFAFLTRSHTHRPTSRGTNRRDSGNHSFSLLGYLVPNPFHPGPYNHKHTHILCIYVFTRTHAHSIHTCIRACICVCLCMC